MIHVIIPVFNRAAYTRSCLQSLAAQDFRDFRVIVCNDGSTDETEEMLVRDFPWVTVLHGDGNLWWSGAMNMGVQHVLRSCAKDDYILSLNNDLTVDVSYLGALAKCAVQRPNALIGSLVLNSRSGAIEDGGVYFNSYTAAYRAVHVGKSLSQALQAVPGHVLEVDLLSGRGALIPVSVFTTQGLYNADQLPQYAGDYEFSHRAKQAGYRLYYSYEALVHSFPESSGLNAKRYDSLYNYLTNPRSPARMKTRIAFAGLVTKSNLQFCTFLTFDTLRIILHYFINKIRRSFSSNVKG